MFLLLACAPASEGLLPTPPGNGPEVTVDWDALPLPEIPWPNDLAARADPTSPTGLRLNLSTVATTIAESEARAKLDELVGFGIYSPLTVSFEAPLDLDAVLARHPDDFHVPGHFEDDAVFVIDVDPSSPHYLVPVALDIGHGRFPADVPRTDRYFPNDPRSTIPSVLFDTTDEDVDGDGVLDPGEDTDFDGLLDIPNVWPPDGDPRDDLLTWYERVSDTLILRSILPLREETTYAVVLTSALVGTDGQPVRSPWAWVNHTRQTEALRPVLDALDALGRPETDLAFAWSFTTGRVTGDLVDIRRGLMEADGPWSFLAEDYPPGVIEAHTLHALPGTPTRLPLDAVLDPFISLGLFDEEGVDYLADAYDSYSSDLVGGAFLSPNLLADRDDGGRDASDEWWQLDPVAGTLHAEPARVAFTCLLPKEDPARGIVEPFPVVLHGHGYGSTRIEFVAFAHAMNEMGWAHCSMDFPGHGPGVSPDEEVLVQAALDGAGVGDLWNHLLDARYVDLDNDGRPDSGGDQWSADAFHTRDMVRQAVVDWMALIGSLRACGLGEMDVITYDAFGQRVPSGTLKACDFDDDGAPDIGGSFGRISVDGGSLGGIVVGVAAGVIPGVEAWAPIVPGAGIVDVAVRTEIGGAVEAMHGRLMSPLFLGYPNGDGTVRIVQMVNSVMDMRELEVGTLPSIPPGGRVVVDNLFNGERREVGLLADGSFRVGIAADGLDPAEKAIEAGIPTSGPAPDTVYEVADNSILGDPLVVTVFDADGAEVARFDTWPADVLHEGVTMRAGTPLVAGSHGLGHIRATPIVRRLAGVLAAALEPGDPAAYARHWFVDPLPGMTPQRVLVMPTPGDTIVNINTGIAAARIAGIVPFDQVDPRFGITADRWLIDRGVVQGLEEFRNYVGADGTPVLYDADDLDNGTDGTGAPTLIPLRLSVPVGDGVSALRLPYVDPTGTHGFSVPDPSLPFDTPNFAIHQAALFLSSGGTLLSDDACLARGDCVFRSTTVGAP